MFKSLKNIDTAFRQIRAFGIIFVLCISAICIYTIWSSYRLVEKSRQKIYVLDQGKSLILALSQDINQNRPAEARDHIKRFHELFFTLSPDPKSIKHNMEEALFLCDQSASQEYKNLQESGYYNDLISGNISQSIKINKVEVNFEKYPYYAKTYAVQMLVRTSSITERNLVTECWLRNELRSDNNPHGFLMEKWRVLENNHIRSYER